MGRGRHGPIEQSQKKPRRIAVTRKKGQMYWHFVEKEKDNSMLLADDFLEAVKKMEPKDVVAVLLQN